jgi:hypothetical protein
MNAILIQTWAMFVDAYRELNSKKLFWFTLGISVLVVSAFAGFGLSNKGLTFLWWEWSMPMFNTNFIPKEKFYKYAFAVFGVPIWLTWAATILALISTASLIPDFIASGSIELTLSKPISRLRLIATKFLTGMTFVGLQVFVFTLCCFLVIGIRGQSWVWSLFLSVPIVLLFFSYLYSVCMLFGLLTRSTIASLLLTMLFWFVLWGINTTDTVFVMQGEQAKSAVVRAERTLARREASAKTSLEKLRAEGKAPGENGVPLPEGITDPLDAVNPMLRPARETLAEAEASSKQWARWNRLAFGIKTVLPKTGETIALLNRYLLTDEDREMFGPNSTVEVDSDDETTDKPPASSQRGQRRAERDNVANRAQKVMLARSAWWVTGTSIAFEAVVLLLCVQIFRRRDF